MSSNAQIPLELAAEIEKAREFTTKKRHLTKQSMVLLVVNELRINESITYEGILMGLWKHFGIIEKMNLLMATINNIRQQGWIKFSSVGGVIITDEGEVKIRDLLKEVKDLQKRGILTKSQIGA